MNVKLEHGDLVLVVDSLNYTGRRGVLKPNSGDPEDIWDYTVQLTEGTENTKLAKKMSIGVYESQVLPLSLAGVKPMTQRAILATLPEEGLRNVITGCIVEFGDTPLRSEKFLEVKMMIQGALRAWANLNSGVKPMLTEWCLLGGKAGTLTGYLESITRLHLLIARAEDPQQ